MSDVGREWSKRESNVAPQPSGDSGELDAKAVEDERWLENEIQEADLLRNTGRAGVYRRILARLRGSPVPAVEGGNDAGSDRT